MNRMNEYRQLKLGEQNKNVTFFKPTFTNLKEINKFYRKDYTIGIKFHEKNSFIARGISYFN